MPAFNTTIVSKTIHLLHPIHRSHVCADVMYLPHNAKTMNICGPTLSDQIAFDSFEKLATFNVTLALVCEKCDFATKMPSQSRFGCKNRKTCVLHVRHNFKTLWWYFVSCMKTQISKTSRALVALAVAITLDNDRIPMLATFNSQRILVDGTLLFYVGRSYSRKLLALLLYQTNECLDCFFSSGLFFLSCMFGVSPLGSSYRCNMHANNGGERKLLAWIPENNPLALIMHIWTRL